MTQAKLVTALRNVVDKVAYMVFTEQQKPPYIIYALPDNDTLHADNSHYHSIPNGWVELYMQKFDFELMKQIESVFEANGLPWEKENEVYIESEKLCQVRWGFQLF